MKNKPEKTFAQLGYPGRLIAVEGIDGSGKSTQLYLLKRWLELQGLKVFFSEWNSSELVKSATRRGKAERLLTPTTFSLIHATDFADRYERQLVPLLKAGYIVLCDRYKFTAFARDTVRGCSPLDVALGRILRGRPQLKYHEAGMDLGLSSDIEESFKLFQGRLLKVYSVMKSEFGLIQINANQPIEKQQEQVRQRLAASIDLGQYELDKLS